MQWYRILSLLSLLMSIHIYSAEQVLLKPQRRPSIVAKRVRSTRSLLLMYHHAITKAEKVEAQEQEDHVQDTFPPTFPFKFSLKSADSPPLVRAEHLSHELDLKTARSHGSSSRGSSVAPSPNESPSGSPREEEVILAEHKKPKRA